jgi:hypothetical protein
MARKVKGRTNTTVEVEVQGTESVTPKVLEFMIEQGEEYRVQEENEQYFIIDGAEFGYPEIQIKVPKKYLKPVTPWETIALIMIAVFFVVWYVQLVVENNSINLK